MNNRFLIGSVLLPFAFGICQAQNIETGAVDEKTKNEDCWRCETKYCSDEVTESKCETMGPCTEVWEQIDKETKRRVFKCLVDPTDAQTTFEGWYLNGVSWATCWHPPGGMQGTPMFDPHTEERHCITKKKCDCNKDKNCVGGAKTGDAEKRTHKSFKRSETSETCTMIVVTPQTPKN